MNQKLKSLLPELELDYPGINLKLLSEEFDYFQLRFLRTGKHHSPDQVFSIFKDELSTGRPLEYINNRAYFYNGYYYVDERVLIPRFESEILIEQALDLNINSLLDLGCGSGCLGISIAKEKKLSRLDFSDISLGALEVSKINFSNHLELNSLEAKFIQSDKFQNIKLKYDAIISNPPYIKRSQIDGVHKNVVEYEPDLALFLEDTEYQTWFLDFFENAYLSLNSQGYLLLEGHEDNLLALKEIAENCNFKNIRLIFDLTDRARVLTMEK